MIYSLRILHQLLLLYRLLNAIAIFEGDEKAAGNWKCAFEYKAAAVLEVRSMSNLTRNISK